MHRQRCHLVVSNSGHCCCCCWPEAGDTLTSLAGVLQQVVVSAPLRTEMPTAAAGNEQHINSTALTPAAWVFTALRVPPLVMPGLLLVSCCCCWCSRLRHAASQERVATLDTVRFMRVRQAVVALSNVDGVSQDHGNLRSGRSQLLAVQSRHRDATQPTLELDQVNLADLQPLYTSWGVVTDDSTPVADMSAQLAHTSLCGVLQLY
jgi:hypothetical protein